MIHYAGLVIFLFLAVIGINLAGEREVLAFAVGERENRAAWEDLCFQLKLRGVRQVDLSVTDGNQAMLGAISSKFPHTAHQRCVKHKFERMCSAMCPRPMSLSLHFKNRI